MPKQTTKKADVKPVKKIVKKTTVKKDTKKTTKKTESSVDTKAKKTTKTSKVPKAEAVKVLVFADDVESFWVNDGQILNSMISLHEALLNMDNEIFTYHVNEERNDFAEWVEKVLCDDNCASDLRKVKNKDGAYKVVAKHLKTYTF